MWIFIIAAVIISALPLINKKIDISNYMWLLIPIDGYGISIAGASIRPYMVFAILLLFITYAKNKGKDFDLSATKGQLLAGIICILILMQSLFDGENLPAITGSIMLIIAYICAQIYTSCTDCSKIEQLSDVFIASCFGYGVVYLSTYFLLKSGVDISGLIATSRAEDGLFMQMSNMSNGQYVEAYRLRGFAYDPNTMFVQFIFGISACVSKLFKKFNLYHMLTILISLICVMLSSSRMGLLCSIFAIVITAIVCISQFESIKKRILSTVSIITSCSVLMMFTVTRVGQSIMSQLFATYSNRSSLTDEYGRFSIWRECLKIYWEKNPLSGVGLGKMSKLTAMERMTHNTWLQFICECGLIIGGITVLYFLSILIIGWVKLPKKHLHDKENTSYLTLVIGYTGVIISLISVDNITNSFLWFTALILLKVAFYTPPNHTLQKQSSAIT